MRPFRADVILSVRLPLTCRFVRSFVRSGVVMRSVVIQSGHGSSPRTKTLDIHSVGDVTFEVGGGGGGGNNATADQNLTDKSFL